MKEEASPVAVAIVLDPAFERVTLHTLAQRSHVWLLGTEANVREARSFWASYPVPTRLSSLTTFTPGPNAEPAARCLAMLETIELHHGRASSPTPFTTLEAIGSTLTPELERELQALGFASFSRSAAGFQAARPAAT